MLPQNFPQRLLACLICLQGFSIGSQSCADELKLNDEPSSKAIEFLESYCYDCHEGSGAEAGFDLTALPTDYAKTDPLKWVRVFDRIKDHEMPPADYGEVDKGEREEFLKATGEWLKAAQTREFKEQGRVRGKRLTNLQLENTLHDLLGVDIPLASRMPDEPRVNGFTTVADGQPMSHFQLEQHVDVIDTALDEAMKRATAPTETLWSKDYDASRVARRRRRRRCREPELIDDFAVTWSSGLVFYGRLPVTTAKTSGWYRITVRTKALNPPKSGSVWCTIRTGKCISTAPLMTLAGTFETTSEVTEKTIIAWLPEQHMFEIRPADAALKRAKFRGGQVGAGEGGPQNVPGVAIKSLTMEKLHLGPSNDEIRNLLFGETKFETTPQAGFKLLSDNSRADSNRLMRTFARRAFRRPVSQETVEPYQKIVHQAIQAGKPLHVALKSGYRALLCSPRFLYHAEQPGRLDDYAIASRLSYFLWDTMPDKELLQLAYSKKLSDPKVLYNQTERMLNHPKADSFVKNFGAQWLDLRLIDFTEPDRKLYPGFDPIVQFGMLEETHAFLQSLLDQDRSVGHLVHADYTFLNSRLARYYGIPNVKGDELRKFKLKPEHHRGGLITQGSILKVTANGTNTSPVVRGVWVSERILGEEIPPPPANVSAIEPDIRGAKTIREQLAKHKNDPSCASCHIKMDPPGFALENYDPSGRWRKNYIKLKGRRRVPGAPIDASSELVNGKSFNNIKQFQKLILEDQHQLATNLTSKLLTYATGAPLAFANREALEESVANARQFAKKNSQQNQYGFRSLIHAAIQSDMFLTK